MGSEAEPAWLRGQRPVDVLEGWGPRSVRRDVALEGADLARGPDDPTDDLRTVGLERVTLRGGEVDLTDTQLSVAWSEVEDVRFRRRVRPVLTAAGTAAQGSFGVRPSVYRRCTFERVRFTLLAGFSLGAARFEECRFVSCRWEGHFAHSADLVGCTFTGPMNGCVWFGEDRREDGTRVNEARDNDFTGVRFTDNVGWRFGFPLADQRFPDGYVPRVDDED